MDKELSIFCGTASMSVVDAMQKIDQNVRGILFVLDEHGALTGCITDGDIRRWLIRTGDLRAEIGQFMNKSPVYISEDEQLLAKKKMKKESIHAIPVLDNSRRVVRILFDEKLIISKAYALKDIPVVIMAGGSGTRLYPYTKILPKPLIPIGDIPIAERIINQFRDFGCHEFHLVVNVKKNMIKAYFNEIEKDYEIYYADEDTPLGTGGGLYLLKGKIDSTFILSNCDILIQDDFEKMISSHRKHKNMITMVSSLKSYPIPYGVVHLGEDGNLENIEEKPQMSFLTNTGVYIIEPEVLDMIPENTFMGFPDIIEMVQKAGNRVGIYPVSEHAWLDMGQMNTLEEMRERLENVAD